MARFIYLTHPQVRMDPSVPVPQWGLSDEGRTRCVAVAGRLTEVGRVVSSRERKAVETAELLAAGRPFDTFEDLGENDRSATGFLPQTEFEAMADLFFAKPEESAKGWERAVDVQSRVVARLQSLISEHTAVAAETAQDATVPQRPGHLVVCGHGAAGTLAYCYFAGLAIDRRHDQMPGGGCFFDMELPHTKPSQGWRRMESL
ncbi:MAG: histidine phosphatase family protein [Pseudomonadota bacterium]